MSCLAGGPQCLQSLLIGWLSLMMSHRSLLLRDSMLLLTLCPKSYRTLSKLMLFWSCLSVCLCVWLSVHLCSLSFWPWSVSFCQGSSHWLTVSVCVSLSVTCWLGVSTLRTKLAAACYMPALSLVSLVVCCCVTVPVDCFLRVSHRWTPHRTVTSARFVSHVVVLVLSWSPLTARCRPWHLAPNVGLPRKESVTAVKKVEVTEGLSSVRQ